MKIESTKTMYLDSVEYVRVFFAESNIFEDVRAVNFDEWKDALGHYE